MEVLIYHMRITLRETHPAIWREFAISGNCGLLMLHKVIQTVMGWWDSHLHAFRIGSNSYAPEYVDPDCLSDDPRKVFIENHFRIRSLLKKGDRFVYEYDFGDGWTHDVEVLRVEPPHEGVQHPICLHGERRCPPEDVGGVYGYEEFLQTINDPEEEEHESMLEWVGGEFDPGEFNREVINDQLRKLR